MSNETSDSNLDSHLANNKSFRGAFSSDNLPFVERNSLQTYIVNLQPSNEGGSHWCTILEYPKQIYYIDPFGEPPPKNVLKWLKKKGKIFSYNTLDVQGLNSSACGKYCKYIISKASLGEKPD